MGTLLLSNLPSPNVTYLTVVHALILKSGSGSVMSAYSGERDRSFRAS